MLVLEAAARDVRAPDGRGPRDADGELAAAIRAPLLIGHGASDPRVARRESDQLVATLRGNAIAVRYVVFDDEGHGFMRPINARRFHAETEAFLAAHLGGRAEPAHPGDEIEPFLR
jgi:dienelactone hydrolase